MCRLFFSENTIGGTSKDRLNGEIKLSRGQGQAGGFVLCPNLSGRFEFAEDETKILNASKIVSIRFRGPPTKKPLNEIGVIKPRAVELKRVVKGAFQRTPFKTNRKMIREIQAFGPGPVGPQGREQSVKHSTLLI